jgi:anti-sigma regulatory factor (Ser/Thr protein kinase)
MGVTVPFAGKDLRMGPTMTKGATGTQATFRHEALFYAGQAEFLDGTTSFIEEGLAAGEPILAVVSAEKIRLLRSALGDKADQVEFADMNDVGRNPARIIPAWQRFVAHQAGESRRFRGIGEPIWAARTPDELVECERHESLLNLAFADAPAWWLLCPYDQASLPGAVLREAERSHPVLWRDGRHVQSTVYTGLSSMAQPFDRPLPEPDARPEEMRFGERDLAAVRRFAARHAATVGLEGQRAADLVLAVNELASNSLRHGGGAGLLRVWSLPESVVCEVRDAGRIEDPLVGRRIPAASQEGGFGTWLVTQVCDLVQVRTFSSGSVVRIHMSRR